MEENLTNCPDCAAPPGQRHEPGCDVERCPCCGGQLISCGCEFEYSPRRIPWSGEWPGVSDARELGFFCYWRTGWKTGWVRCEADHPKAIPDLNRLVIDAVWNRELQKFVHR